LKLSTPKEMFITNLFKKWILLYNFVLNSLLD
jgi:hypothetical protein